MQFPKKRKGVLYPDGFRKWSRVSNNAVSEETKRCFEAFHLGTIGKFPIMPFPKKRKDLSDEERLVWTSVSNNAVSEETKSKYIFTGDKNPQYISVSNNAVSEETKRNALEFPHITLVSVSNNAVSEETKSFVETNSNKTYKVSNNAVSEETKRLGSWNPCLDSILHP